MLNVFRVIDSQGSASLSSRIFEKHLLKEDVDLDIITIQTNMTEELSEENRKTTTLRQKGILFSVMFMNK